MYEDCSDAMDIMSVPWNVVFMCTINDQVQKLKRVQNSFFRIVNYSEETVLQGMIDKLIETGRYCGMEMNVEETKVTK